MSTVITQVEERPTTRLVYQVIGDGGVVEIDLTWYWIVIATLAGICAVLGLAAYYYYLQWKGGPYLVVRKPRREGKEVGG